MCGVMLTVSGMRLVPNKEVNGLEEPRQTRTLQDVC